MLATLQTAKDVLPFGVSGWSPADLVNPMSPAYNLVSSVPVRAITSTGAKNAGGILSSIGSGIKMLSPGLYDAGGSVYRAVSPLLYSVGKGAYKLASPVLGVAKSGARHAYNFLPSVYRGTKSFGRAAYSATPSIRETAGLASRAASGAYNYVSPILKGGASSVIKRVSPALLGAGAAAMAGYKYAKPILTEIAKKGRTAAYIAPFALAGANLAGFAVPAAAVLAAEYASTAAGIGDTMLGDSPDGKIGAGIHGAQALYKMHSAMSRTDSIGQVLDALQAAAHVTKSMAGMGKKAKFGCRTCRYDSRGKKYRARRVVKRR